MSIFHNPDRKTAFKRYFEDTDVYYTNYPKKLLALDPGETIGWAFIDDLQFDYNRDIGHLTTNGDLTSAILKLDLLIHELKPTHIVYEDYRVYAWKAKSHTGNELFTTKVIGVLEAICVRADIPTYKQMAQHVKQFCTDDKLKIWGMYTPPYKHGRDAARHATYYTLFNHRKTLKEQ